MNLHDMFERSSVVDHLFHLADALSATSASRRGKILVSKLVDNVKRVPQSSSRLTRSARQCSSHLPDMSQTKQRRQQTAVVPKRASASLQIAKIKVWASQNTTHYSPSTMSREVRALAGTPAMGSGTGSSIFLPDHILRHRMATGTR